jgi:hypothetical protein
MFPEPLGCPAPPRHFDQLPIRRTSLRLRTAMTQSLRHQEPQVSQSIGATTQDNDRDVQAGKILLKRTEEQKTMTSIRGLGSVENAAALALRPARPVQEQLTVPGVFFNLKYLHPRKCHLGVGR